MSAVAPRRILALTGLLVALGTIAGTANAEPKNDWPFTRPVSAQTLHQSVRRQAVTAIATPEAKNELPFTRPVGAATAANHVAATPAASTSGFNWTLAAWIAALVVAVVGSGIALARRVQLTTRTPA